MWHTPDAWIATWIMPSVTSGTGTPSMVSGWPNARTTAAFIVFAMGLLLSDKDQAGMGAVCRPRLDYGQKKPSFLAE